MILYTHQIVPDIYFSNIYTPCSVNTYGLLRDLLLIFAVTNCDRKCSSSSSDNWNIISITGYQVLHSHDVSLHEVWTINTQSRHALKLYFALTFAHMILISPFLHPCMNKMLHHSGRLFVPSHFWQILKFHFRIFGYLKFHFRIFGLTQQYKYDIILWRNEVYYRTVYDSSGLLVSFFIVTTSYKYNFPSSSRLTKILARKMLYLSNTPSSL